MKKQPASGGRDGRAGVGVTYIVGAPTAVKPTNWGGVPISSSDTGGIPKRRPMV